jgi:hypothetical protein
MKKSLLLVILITSIMAVSAQAFIIWDWDSPATTPVSFGKNGYAYVYATISNYNTHGIGGSSALEVDLPYETNANRVHGDGVWLSMMPNWTTASTGIANMTTNNINLSGPGNSTVYFSVMANTTNNFGVGFAVWDTSGGFFIDSSAVYIADSAIPAIGAISTTTFQMVTYPLQYFHVYNATHHGRPPALANINAFEWYLCKTSGVGSGSAGLAIYLDNVGAYGSNLNNFGTPVELSNFEAVENRFDNRKY